MDPVKSKKNHITPWYKIPMVWFVIALPMIAVVASLTTVVIAAKNRPVVIEHNESYKKVGEKPTR